MAPTDSIQVFKLADLSPSEVYLRIYDRMNSCHVVHNIFDPGDIVGGLDADRQHGRIYFAHDGVALWGADLEPSGRGTRVTTRVGKGAASDRYHALIRAWGEARRPPAVATADC
jgi:hypothetical protein